MGWNLFLAHFLGDFVFQNEWMVRNRNKLWVLTLHASTHLLLMILLIGPSRSVLWPFIVLVAAIHFIQDRLKIILTEKKPKWMVSSYVIDQLLHYVLLIAVINWIKALGLITPLPDKSFYVISAIALVLVSFVWFVSERMFNLDNVDYLESINHTKYSRMLARAGLVSIFLLIRTTTAAVLSLTFLNPYPESEFRRRAVRVDLAVSAAAILFLIFALK